MKVASMIKLASGMQPSLGQLINSNADPELLNRINQEASANAGGIVFGDSSDPYAHKYNRFMEKVIMPMQEIGEAIKGTVENLDAYQTNYVRVASALSLNNIPDETKEVILTHPTIYKQFKDGKISDWGIKNPKNLQAASEVYDRVYKRNQTHIIMNAEDEVVIEWEWLSTDPEFSDKEEEAITKTREFVDEFLWGESTKNIDITNYPEEINEGKLKE